MKFKLKCALWRVNVNGKITSYYMAGIEEKDLEKEVDVDTIEDLKNLIEEYKYQFRNKYYRDSVVYTSKDVIVNFETRTIMFYNDYIE